MATMATMERFGVDWPSLEGLFTFQLLLDRLCQHQLHDRSLTTKYAVVLALLVLIATLFLI